MCDVHPLTCMACRGSQAGRLWSEIVRRRYDYGRPWRSAKRLRGVKRAGLLAFYDERIAPGAPDGRRLSTHVFSTKDAPSQLVEDPLPDDFFPPPVDRYASFREGKQLA